MYDITKHAKRRNGKTIIISLYFNTFTSQVKFTFIYQMDQCAIYF